MEKIHANTRFCAYSLKFYTKAQKHACFDVFLHLVLTILHRRVTLLIIHKWS